MPAGNNNFVDTDAKIKDFLNAVLSSEGIVVDIRRTFINYNGVNRSRVFARRANEMASKGGNEKFVVIALMCYPALQWILQAQDIDRLVEELREQNPDESVSRISYTAEENEIPGYTTTIEKTDTGYVFTNTHIPETVTVTVDKVWDDSENQDGLRPDTIHIKLVSNGIAKDAYLDADSNWHLEFEGLPKYRDHGILNEYSVQEVDVDGYTSTVTTEDGYAFTIKNDHVPAVIDIPITEEWIDDNNRDGLRPSSHTVILTDGINTIEEIVLDKDNGYGTVLKDS